MPDDPHSRAVPDPARVLSRHLATENEVLRSAAIRAVAGLELAREEALPILAEALLDPDPDVRTDAMAALAPLAGPEEAPLLCRSLCGDPVREVKLAAIAGLERANDAASGDLLRALVRSRAEDLVVWEDENSDWEDWLDVQIACIRALGLRGATAALPDLLAARRDELGQEVDLPVFRALSGMGRDGVGALLEVLEGEGGLSRRRAAGVLADMDSDLLRDRAWQLLALDDAHLRALGIALLAPTDPEVASRARSDPEPSVRIAALRHAAAPTLFLEALQDPSPEVQAAALERVERPASDDLRAALRDNMLAWCASAPRVLKTAAVRRLPVIAPEMAVAPLLSLAEDPEAHLEIRVAAVRALGGLGVGVDALTPLLACRAQQVRAAVLCELAGRPEDPDAVKAIAAAMAGTWLTPADLPEEGEELTGPDVGMAKSEGGPRRIAISREGHIIGADPFDAGPETSTLASILGPPAPVPEAEDTPEETAAKRRRRRAVEGPDDVIRSLSSEALQSCAPCPGREIETALLERAGCTDLHLRRLAWTALAERPDRSSAVDAAAALGAQDTDPAIRLAALRAARTLPADALARMGGDPDPLIRAAAVARMPTRTALAFAADPALAVRQAAADRILEADASAATGVLVDTLLAAERVDTLSHAMRRSEVARACVLAHLGRELVTPRDALVLLEACARRQHY
ncbi:MAG: HEAT repeat domain-containing protein [Pseudomonadota bacterium]